jgi:plastocyanin
MKGFNSLEKASQGRQHRPAVILTAGALVLLTQVLAACGQAAPTSVPATQPPAAAPTSVPASPEPTAAPTDLPAPAAITPSVTVSDQAIVEDSVTIAQVVSAGPGWLVVHIDAGGKPGPVLGYSPVSAGENTDVVVGVDTSDATQTLYAMLHLDAGTVGTYEFPGPDAPVLIGDQMVSPPFQITGGLAAAPTPQVTSAPAANPTPAPSATGTAASPPAAVFGDEVELEDFKMVPQILTVKVGTEVKFSNKDQAVHTVTSDTGLFDSGPLQKGQDFFYTFTQVGEYPYYCAPHGGPGGQGMSGKIIVVP